jgi:predicted nucleic acid-binding protein
LVVDASLALSWLFLDEQTSERMKILDQVSASGAMVPSLWRLEMANALQFSVRRQRITSAYRDAAIHKLSLLPIQTDSETNVRAWTHTLHLADLHCLTVYDACYLELAIRSRLPLATRDVELIAAAGNAGVILLPA